MNNTDENSQYKDIIKILGGLQKVKAPANFEADLIRRINSGKYEKEKSFRGKFFLFPWLIPSTAVAVAAVIILLVVNINSGTEENPLLAPPRVRENVVASSDVPLTKNETTVKKQEQKVKREIKQQHPVISGESTPSFAVSQPGQNDSEVSNLGITITGGNNQDAPQGNPSIVSFSNGYPINKNGLNYRQRNLTREERIHLELLKKQMEEMFRGFNK